MKTKRVKYDAVKLAIIRKNYMINEAINDLVRDLPHCDFEKLRFQLTNEIMELQSLKSEGLNSPSSYSIVITIFSPLLCAASIFL